MLLNNRANVNVENASKVTPIMLAASIGDYDLFMKFISYGANVFVKDAFDSTVLHYAVIGGSTDLINDLYETIESVQGQSNVDVEALASSIDVTADRLNIINYLLGRGVDANAKDAQGNTPLYYAVAIPSLDMFNALIGGGADINVKNNMNQTMLFAAVFGGDMRIIQYVVDSNIDVNGKR